MKVSDLKKGGSQGICFSAAVVEARLSLNSGGCETTGEFQCQESVVLADYSGQSLEATVVISSLNRFCAIIMGIVLLISRLKPGFLWFQHLFIINFS